jgi:hypothetical protein
MNAARAALNLGFRVGRWDEQKKAREFRPMLLEAVEEARKQADP